MGYGHFRILVNSAPTPYGVGDYPFSFIDLLKRSFYNVIELRTTISNLGNVFEHDVVVVISQFQRLKQKFNGP